jgi:hypothetical protein
MTPDLDLDVYEDACANRDTCIKCHGRGESGGMMYGFPCDECDGAGREAFMHIPLDDLAKLIAALRSERERAEAWRLAIELALGLESDPENHTPSWAHEVVLEIREIGNRPNAWKARALAAEAVAACFVGVTAEEVDAWLFGPNPDDFKAFYAAKKKVVGGIESLAAILREREQERGSTP